MANPPNTRRGGRTRAQKLQEEISGGEEPSAASSSAAGDQPRRSSRQNPKQIPLDSFLAPRASSPFDSPAESGSHLSATKKPRVQKNPPPPMNLGKEDTDASSVLDASAANLQSEGKDQEAAATPLASSKPPSSAGKNAYRDARRKDADFEGGDAQEPSDSESQDVSEEEDDNPRYKRRLRSAGDWVESDSDRPSPPRRSSRSNSRRSSTSAPSSSAKKSAKRSKESSASKPVLRPQKLSSGTNTPSARASRTNSKNTSVAVDVEDTADAIAPDTTPAKKDDRPHHQPRVTRQAATKDGTKESEKEKTTPVPAAKPSAKESIEEKNTSAASAEKKPAETNPEEKDPSEELGEEDPEEDAAEEEEDEAKDADHKPPPTESSDSSISSDNEDHVLSGPDTPGRGGESLYSRVRNLRDRVRRSGREKKDVSRFTLTPPRSKSHRDRKSRRKHGASSSGSDGSSSSETAWRRKNKAKEDLARSAITPVNLSAQAIADMANNRSSHHLSLPGSAKDDKKKKAAQSLEKADIHPMQIDQSISWDSIGGLNTHIKALKEMVLFPLLYPEVFARFNMTPPRGVLFYGPPGTGKTLMARALANTCSQAGNRVAFFMRKGADCLSKWVGEAERQLRLLFEEAAKVQPSIIFFDEIDGLAPVRSSRQDQIHNSIVSTLLALMDGLDSRGQIIVIGATNRIDTIDPALRRPGRFDREFPFMLPSQQARREIIAIHTKTWNPPVEPKLLEEIADLCVGYCGADLKSLATEAALRALRRRYPQIYESNDKLLIDPAQLVLTRADFLQAMRDITPAQARVSISNAAPLPTFLRPLLSRPLDKVIAAMQQMFPPLRHRRKQRDFAAAATADSVVATNPSSKDDEEDEDAVFQIGEITVQSFKFGSHAPLVNRPRLLLCGADGNQGQPHVAAAVLHRFEEVPVFSLDFASLNADISAKSMEEACVHIISEARRKLPAVLFLPHLDSWYHAAHESLRLCLHNLLNDIPPSLPLFLLATADTTFDRLPHEAAALFPDVASYELTLPDTNARMEFFCHVAIDIATPPEPKSRRSAQQLEVLPKAPVAQPLPPTPLTLEEKKRKEQEHDRHWLRELRMTLRDFIHRLLSERKYRVFEKPVQPEDVPDYYELIKKPICLELMLQKIDCHRYKTLSSFVADIELLVENAKQYNDPLNDPMRVISKANHLRDNIEHMLVDMDDECFEKCDEIAARKRAEGDEKWDQSDAEAPYQRSIIPKARPPRGPGLYDAPDPLAIEKAELRKLRGMYSKKSSSSKNVDEMCEICHSTSHAARMLLCDGCDRGYHTFCLHPPLKHIPSGDWFCPECVLASELRKERMATQQKEMQPKEPQKEPTEKNTEEKDAEENGSKDGDMSSVQKEAEHSLRKRTRGGALESPSKAPSVPHNASSAAPAVSLETPPKAGPPSPPDSRKRRRFLKELQTPQKTLPDEEEKEKETEKATPGALSLISEKKRKADSEQTAPHTNGKAPDKEKKEKEQPKETVTVPAAPPAASASSSSSAPTTEKASETLSEKEKEKPEKELSSSAPYAQEKKLSVLLKEKELARQKAMEREKELEKQKAAEKEPASMQIKPIAPAVPALPPPPVPREPSPPPPPPFVFDLNRARAVVADLVKVTEGFNVEELCATHAKVQRSLFDHRGDYDRSQMTTALDKIAQSLRLSHPQH